MLEKLFTSRARVKILDYLFFYKKESYIREIAEKLKIHPSAAKRELDNLLSLGIVQKQKNRISLNEANAIVPELKRIFLKTDSIKEPIKKALQKLDIQYALVFGSFAQEKYTPESDIDLMIIGNCRQSEAFAALKPAEKIIERDINPIVWTQEELMQNKNRGFTKDVMKKSKIMIKGDEDELKRIAG